MPHMNMWLSSDLQRDITADVTLQIDTAVAHGAGNREFVRGALSLARSQCARYGISWRAVLADVKGDLDADGMALLDSTRMIEEG